jgi:hypothetical protein
MKRPCKAYYLFDKPTYVLRKGDEILIGHDGMKPVFSPVAKDSIGVRLDSWCRVGLVRRLVQLGE